MRPMVLSVSGASSPQVTSRTRCRRFPVGRGARTALAKAAAETCGEKRQYRAQQMVFALRTTLAVTRAMVPRPGIGGTGGHHLKRTLSGRPAERVSQRLVIPPQQSAAPVVPSPAACPSLQAAPVTAAVPRPGPSARRICLVPAPCRSAPSRHRPTAGPSICPPPRAEHHRRPGMRINLLFRLNRPRQNRLPGPCPDPSHHRQAYPQPIETRRLAIREYPRGRHRQLHRAPHPNRNKTLHPAR